MQCVICYSLNRLCVCVCVTASINSSNVRKILQKQIYKNSKTDFIQTTAVEERDFSRELSSTWNTAKTASDL